MTIDFDTEPVFRLENSKDLDIEPVFRLENSKWSGWRMMATTKEGQLTKLYRKLENELQNYWTITKGILQQKISLNRKMDDQMN